MSTPLTPSPYNSFNGFSVSIIYHLDPVLRSNRQRCMSGTI